MIRSLLVLSLVVVSCRAKSSDEVGGSTADNVENLKWEPNREDPSFLFSGADTRLLSNINKNDVGATFGVADDKVPYPDTYWPFTDDGIDANWTDTKSPLEKYMALADPARQPDAKDWEKNNHGSAVPGVDSWWGHCPGWTAAAMTNAPIKHAVHARFEGGQFVSCAAGSAGCTKFEIGDINALMAEVNVDAASHFIGARCDTKPSDIPRDEDGRVLQSGCRGLNAGALVVVLGNVMRHGAAVALDAQNEANTDQIWNQPAYRFSLYRYLSLSEAEATTLVRQKDTTNPDYKWNDSAKGFVFVDIGIWWVTEYGPNRTEYSGLNSTREMRVTAVLELDGDPEQASTKIIGGEYLDDTSAGANRLIVPPFMWTATAPGPETLPLTVTGNHHNPYVKPSLVAQLVALGQ